MQFNIEDVRDIAKLLGAIRVMAKGKFKVSKELLDEVLTRLHSIAKERGIAIKIVSPSGERIIEFTAHGVIVGAMVGFYVGQLPGALIGAVVGGFAGYCAAHTRLVMDRPDDSDHVVVQIA
ncbi:glycine zipper domain-containing protein [Burkholderia sp. Cy-637]|uniref:glycine zipper domain-containing protein n=1 Tax=Burkholderia sp. Cy-637 TaxID=2608327 RepID=UPI001422201A|nr:glycine zipper domain-containing protein [Burkholderia sp. Cy-637]